MACGYNYAELQAISNFSFLRGGSHPEELINRASELGYKGLAIADFSSMAGAVRAHLAAVSLGIQYICACRLELDCSEYCSQSEREGSTIPLVACPTTRLAYGNLCRLLTNIKTGKRQALKLEDLLAAQKEMALIVSLPEEFRLGMGGAKQESGFLALLTSLRENASGQAFLSLALTKHYARAERQQTELVLRISGLSGIPVVAVQDACYHEPSRRPLQDVLSCIRSKCTLEQAGELLLQNAQRYLKPPAEIYRLFRQYPAALRRTLEIAELCQGFSFEQLKYEYPDEICPAGRSPHEYLAELVQEGAGERYPADLSPKVKDLIEQELQIIEELAYEKYFLTCYDIVRFARSRGILCQGRGAAANSAVCYCLGITSVDPEKIDLLFARFVSRERNEPPDIDIDFEHERREEVIQYIYSKYGRDRAGLVCEVISYRGRSAMRDVGKAFGLPPDVVGPLAKSIHHWTGSALRPEDLRTVGLDPESVTVRNAISIALELQSFPRHLSQHVGGFIISQQPLCEIVPISAASMPGRTVIEWDKDDVEALGLLKIDVLALGMLSCIRKALDYINARRDLAGTEKLELHSIPAEDPQVYDMLSRSDTIGVFQIESRAQMSMLPRLKPRCFYDLVIEVAIVRPGPIQGGMVHPYLRRRSGQEKVHYPDARAEAILGKTLGVPLFQEQAMRLAIVLANFTPGEAERLRRCMAAWKRSGAEIASFEQRIIDGMLSNGYSLDFARSCVSQIRGFSEYGFPESHAASFALLVYASAWLKCHYPAEFATALINSQPMGFYAPSQIVSDARSHGVEVRPVDVNSSGWDCSLEKDSALRLGMRLVRGLGRAKADIVAEAVQSYGPSTSPHQLWQRMQDSRPGTGKTGLLLLARADAFVSMGLSSRQASWEILALPSGRASLRDLPLEVPGRVDFIQPPDRQQALFQDYETSGLSLKGHPLEFVRARLAARSVQTVAALRKVKIARQKQPVAAAGMVLVRQRPPTAKGVAFITIEDETGTINLIVRPEVFEKYRVTILKSSFLAASGRLQRIGEMIYIEVEKLRDISWSAGLPWPERSRRQSRM